MGGPRVGRHVGSVGRLAAPIHILPRSVSAAPRAPPRWFHASAVLTRQRLEVWTSCFLPAAAWIGRLRRGLGSRALAGAERALGDSIKKRFAFETKFSPELRRYVADSIDEWISIPARTCALRAFYPPSMCTALEASSNIATLGGLEPPDKHHHGMLASEQREYCRRCGTR